ncbi:MAG: hypothetical protein MZU91_00405 [Desulfosudis oleivorans]|nr:hypothetical protein [Desulfosudis oleivorans]
MSWDGSELEDRQRRTAPAACTASTKMTKALRPGDETGRDASCIGGKAPIVEGALLSWVHRALHEGRAALRRSSRTSSGRSGSWWDEHGKNRERSRRTHRAHRHAVLPRVDRRPACPQHDQGASEGSLLVLREADIEKVKAREAEEKKLGNSCSNKLLLIQQGG